MVGGRGQSFMMQMYNEEELADRFLLNSRRRRVAIRCKKDKVFLIRRYDFVSQMRKCF